MPEMIKHAGYKPDDSGEAWQCVIHNRRATWLQVWTNGHTQHCCDPKLGGIMLPCNCERVEERP